MRKHIDYRAYGYISPALVSILLFTILPIAFTVFISFTNYNLYHVDVFETVGWKNYQTVFGGEIRSAFLSVLGWTVLFAVLSTAGFYFVGMLLATLLNNPHMRESKIYRTVLIIL